jgi:hypothetical protein
LVRIGAWAFSGTSLSSVVVPENASFIAGRVFPINCLINCGRSRHKST